MFDVLRLPSLADEVFVHYILPAFASIEVLYILPDFPEIVRTSAPAAIANHSGDKIDQAQTVVVAAAMAHVRTSGEAAKASDAEKAIELVVVVVVRHADSRNPALSLGVLFVVDGFVAVRDFSLLFVSALTLA